MEFSLLTFILAPFLIYLVRKLFGKAGPDLFWFPVWKNENYGWIRKSVQDGSLPKIFKAHLFNWKISHWISGNYYIITVEFL